MAAKKTEKVEQTEPKFSKVQLVASERFSDRRDVVNALLDDNEQYTITEVEKIINDFMKGQVK